MTTQAIHSASSMNRMSQKGLYNRAEVPPLQTHLSTKTVCWFAAGAPMKWSEPCSRSKRCAFMAACAVSWV